MRRIFLCRAGAGVVAATLLAGCSGGSTPSPTPSSPTAPTGPAAPAGGGQTVAVNIVGSSGNRAYAPNPVAANTGDTIVFRNSDVAVHRIVLDDGTMDFGDVVPGGASRTYRLSGNHPLTYHCVNHPSMVGSINGASAPVPPDCTDPYGYECS